MRNVRVYVALLVSVVWCVSYVVAMITMDYAGVTLVTPVMLAAVGLLLAANGKGKNGAS